MQKFFNKIFSNLNYMAEDEHEDVIFGLAFLGILLMLLVYMLLGHYFEHKNVKIIQNFFL